ncbi:coatomer subunit alpha-1-like [Cryptomeria japonica]|uniref:coatomer subunit alpha-1-like n=1 Tax=Cryptomeria japonica TaxID=3369 RepID=UPI0027D9DC25|nr:coatomer subunit alpha-1-like [Cryptomeria japonica]
MGSRLDPKGNRVLGLSFHPKRPWILASLHSGVIRLWDYRMGILIDTFDEHHGPVRGVHFHKSQPLFVSGGDDCKIKVWNYKIRRCLFTLTGHLDYIRTVNFHNEYPWIVSASDDQTIRIWNWQSRVCISILSGHNHYVMCASFHLKEDLVVSASLDQTIRVWDVSALRKQTVSPANDILKLAPITADLFGGGDIVVKYVLEGHDRGVNWASFHPSLPLIVSGADDRQVKLWRMNDTKAWEVDTLRGHIHNVCCVLFHARQDIIVSNSEDKSIRVWDMSKRTCVQNFCREYDRFWVLSAHPEVNLLAAGHDSGMIVFKLERERPAYVVFGGWLLYIKDRFLRFYEFATQKDNSSISIRKPLSSGPNQGPRSLSYSPTEYAVLICSDVDDGSYELYVLPPNYSPGRSNLVHEPKRGIGGSAVFIARNRFAVLDKSHYQVTIKNLKNEVTKKCDLPFNADKIFSAGTGNLLCRSEDSVILFDLQQRTNLGEIRAPNVKYIVWSNDMENVALLSKHAIIIASKKLSERCKLRETIRVKSGAWDDNGIFIYSTLNHIKYCLPNGDSGIIRTLDVPVYITRVSGSSLYCLDRDGKNRVIQIDTSECVFKLALMKKKYDEVMSMIRNSQLCGRAIIAYLQQKGFPEVGLHFARDERTRFKLAVESGNIQTAVASAKEIDEKEHWHKLGVEALRQGNAGIVEYAYQRTKNFEQLSFLYLITGNLDKLTKMLRIAEMKNDVMGQFHNALYLGDIKERIKILQESGHLPLAYITASVHGLTDIADTLAADLGGNLPTLSSGKKSSLLMPPVPILRGGDWPLLRVTKGIFEGGLENSAPAAYGEEDEGNGADWGEDIAIENAERENGQVIMADDKEATGRENEDGGWDMEELELPQDVGITHNTLFVTPTQGMPVSQIWTQKLSLAGEHAVAGNFDTALRLLNCQLGITNFSPLKPIILDLYMGGHVFLPTLASLPVVPLAVERDCSDTGSPNVRAPPALVYSLSVLEEKRRVAYRATTEGKFSEALRLFVNILHTIPVIVVETGKEVDEVKKMIGIVKEYVLGLRMEVKRKEIKDDALRQQELATYFTHCKLQNAHLILALQNAMSICYKGGNYSTAANMACRLLETDPPTNYATKAIQVRKACERNLQDAKQLNYDFRNPFVVCGSSFTPIYHGQKSVSCPYCTARFVPSMSGKLCTICDLSIVGSDASGLLCSATQTR